MTVAGAQTADGTAGSTAEPSVVNDWEAVRSATEIQYEPLPPFKPPETPGWLKTLGEWLRSILEPVGEALGVSWPVLQYVLIALAAVLALYILWHLLAPTLERLRARKPEEEGDWAPDRTDAEALLEDADRLAGEGRYAEAVHLLLRRSVGHIASARPDWVIPASTAREIASFPLLSDRARSTFGVIAARVERSLFALRDLDAEDWRTAREAYAEFALVDLSAGRPGRVQEAMA
ncbi:hypothetical protein GCM10011371_21650 [Novosphingobium marinum]|nr:hypothetical protein GCM10011371_21650 [Novosphingobium marinum]